MNADYLDRYSRGTTVCHRWTVNRKLGLTFGVILTSLLIPVSLWPMQGVLLSLIFIAQTVAEIPLRYLLQRLAGFLPMVGIFALTLWLGQPGGRGGDFALNLLLRSTVSFMAALWLVNVTPFSELLIGLRRWGLPQYCVALLAFMYRYIFVIFDELERMRTARRARSFGRISLARDWGSRGQLLGMLFIRALSRAERIQGAMSARGWDGEVRTLPKTVTTTNS
ncbi:MAG: cobalt ECF transporter T component CbiQ [Planctomycetales bacterium]